MQPPTQSKHVATKLNHFWGFAHGILLTWNALRQCAVDMRDYSQYLCLKLTWRLALCREFPPSVFVLCNKQDDHWKKRKHRQTNTHTFDPKQTSGFAIGWRRARRVPDGLIASKHCIRFSLSVSASDPKAIIPHPIIDPYEVLYMVGLRRLPTNIHICKLYAIQPSNHVVTLNNHYSLFQSASHQQIIKIAEANRITDALFERWLEVRCAMIIMCATNT